MIIRLLRYTFAGIRAILLIIPMAIVIFTYLILSKFLFENTPERAFRLRRLYLMYANFILGIKTTVTGAPIKGTALYVSNHRSLSDPLILCQFIDAFVIAKAEVAKYPLISTGAQLTGILYVKREDRNSRFAVREKMKQTLLQNRNVLVYPEGTVNKSIKTLPYRCGTFREIVTLGIPLIPVCLEYRNAKDVWHDRNMFQHFFLQFGYWRTNTRLVIGKPLVADDGEALCRLTEEWTNNTIRQIHQAWPESHFNPASLQ